MSTVYVYEYMYIQHVTNVTQYYLQLPQSLYIQREQNHAEKNFFDRNLNTVFLSLARGIYRSVYFGQKRNKL